VSRVKLMGHSNRVQDNMPLFSSDCITCSNDLTMKVWNCETGVCRRTLTEHTSSVNSLALHSSGRSLASGSLDRSVIIWLCETFEILRRIEFPSKIDCIVFNQNDDTLFVGVYSRGVMSCNTLTGEIGPAVIPGLGSISGLALGKISISSIIAFRSHLISPVPSHTPWTPSTYLLWSLAAKDNVHVAVAVLWKTRAQGHRVALPYELVEIVLHHVL
jgi:WD40 repeat protein